MVLYYSTSVPCVTEPKCNVYLQSILVCLKTTETKEQDRQFTL